MRNLQTDEILQKQSQLLNIPAKIIMLSLPRNKIKIQNYKHEEYMPDCRKGRMHFK